MKVKAVNQGFYGTLREEGDVFDVDYGGKKKTEKVVEDSSWLEPVVDAEAEAKAKAEAEAKAQQKD